MGSARSFFPEPRADTRVNIHCYSKLKQSPGGGVGARYEATAYRLWSQQLSRNA